MENFQLFSKVFAFFGVANAQGSIDGFFNPKAKLSLTVSYTKL